MKKIICLIVTILTFTQDSEAQEFEFQKNHMTGATVGLNQVFDNTIKKDTGFALDVYLFGFYLGVSNNGYYGNGEQLDFKSSSSYYSHKAASNVNFGYSFDFYRKQTEKHLFSAYATPYFSIVRDAEVWQDPIGEETYFLENVHYNTGVGSKVGISLGGLLVGADIGTQGYGIHFGYTFRPKM